MTRYSELLARIEAATQSDARLNAEIACAFIFKHLRPADPTDFDGQFGHSPGNIKVEHGFLQAEHYTGSVDAALNLVDRALPGAWYVIAKGRLTAKEPLYGCELLFDHDEQLGIAAGQTQPLAILAALLKALIAREVVDA